MEDLENPPAPEVAPEAPEPYVPPTGDEPWAQYLENVPDVLQEEIVTAFRAQSAEADKRIGSLTRYQELADADVDPGAAQAALEFASVLYGNPDPNDPAAVSMSKTQRLNFFNSYKGVLEEAGILSRAEAEAESQRQAAEVAAEREFETPEQKELRELKENYEALSQQTSQLSEAQQQEAQQRQETARYTELTTAYAEDWQQAITTNGQVSEREFKIINALAQSDPDDSPGVIGRAYAKMISDFGRMPDAAAAAPAAPRPPVVGAAGGQQIEVPGGENLRFDSPEGRSNRRKVALEEVARLAAQG